MIPQQLIEAKRDGLELSSVDLERFLAAYQAEEVAEEQMAAMLMAVYFQSLSRAELTTLTDVMLHSGQRLDFGHLPGPCVDKHSTGGVGDKVSLVLAPVVAELGAFVPMMSGRALGHTGGTLDKLEAMEGFRTRMPLGQFQEVVAKVGCAMIGQTPEIAPLDGRLYALRDVTGTVPSIPLICASIMSKKLAEGLSGLVLDVKVGDGAFLPDQGDARRLAETMVGLGAERGLPVSALLTAMDRPLGVAVGNGLEVREAVECLRGGGPPDLRELTIRLAAEMAEVCGLEADREVSRRRAAEALTSGSAMERFARMVEAQGGPRGLDTGTEPSAAAPVQNEATADRGGVIQQVRPRTLGFGLISLGGGRTRREQSIDPRVGFEVLVRPGEVVERGQPLARVHVASDSDVERARKVVLEAIVIGRSPPDPPSYPLVLDRIGAAAEGQETSSL
ncbi:MAG: thymidine phosphorylase [Gemmatimonadota bacterium]|nr:thymidine phosphorylase [Gemmatimonadota bacterium]